MATVVNLAKDTRASDLGKGVASFLDRMKDRRIDGLQQELMASIGNAKDEAEATALIGDPKYQEVVTDNNRLSAIVTHMNTVPLGKQSLIGYDKDGNQQILSISERDDPSEAMVNAGLTLERSRIFYAVDPENDFDTPEILGRHSSAESAKDAIPASRQIEKQLIMNQEEATSFMNNRAMTLSARDRRTNTLLSQDQFKFTKEGRNNPFAALEASRASGAISEEFYLEAREKLVTTYGRTSPDVRLKYQQDMLKEGANVAAVSEQMVNMMKMVAEDQNILTGVAKIPAFFDSVGSELATLAGGLGLTARPLSEYETWFESKGLGGRSIAFKNMIVTMALGLAAMNGQSGRSLSDKDFDRFLDVSGADLSDGKNFITNLNQVMRSSQQQFLTRYAIMTRDMATGTPGNWEAEHGKFPSFGSGLGGQAKDKTEFVDTWNEAHPDFLLKLPTEVK